MGHLISVEISRDCAIEVLDRLRRDPEAKTVAELELLREAITDALLADDIEEEQVDE